MSSALNIIDATYTIASRVVFGKATNSKLLLALLGAPPRGKFQKTEPVE